MNKSIKNDADIMLLISQHFNKVSVTESDTVFCVTSKERKLLKPKLWVKMDLVKFQTGTSAYVYTQKINIFFDSSLFIYISI